MPERIDADVCVVGGGYAGLTAARRLSQEGRSVVVLEARDRVGGRIWTHHLPDGSPVDRGGAWLAPGHDAILGLAAEVGVSTYKTWVKGAHLLVGEGRTRRYTGLIPKISPLAVVTIALAQARLDRMARRVPLEAPWTAKRAAEWDSRSVAWWLERSGIRTTIARDLFEMAVRGLFTGDLHDVSLLHLLFLIRGHGSINTLFSIEGGSQENMVEGGAGSIARRVADPLGDAVRLNTPARSITQAEDHVLVGADGLTVSGQTSEPGSAAEVTLDASPVSGSPGVIASFTFGRVAERVEALDPAERRRQVLDALTARLGPRASSPAELIETAWWTEEWTRGCSMAHLPPGILTRHGPLLREPFGRVHWAGTETATTSHGAIDGAVRSGERAAAEVLGRT